MRKKTLDMTNMTCVPIYYTNLVKGVRLIGLAEIGDKQGPAPACQVADIE